MLLCPSQLVNSRNGLLAARYTQQDQEYVLTYTNEGLNLHMLYVCCRQLKNLTSCLGCGVTHPRFPVNSLEPKTLYDLTPRQLHAMCSVDDQRKYNASVYAMTDHTQTGHCVTMLEG